MRKPHLCALLSFVSFAALQTLPAAAQTDRQLSQERWMLRQGLSNARTGTRSDVRVHFFNPTQVVRVSQAVRTPAQAPVVRPVRAIGVPAAARPTVVAETHTAPRLIASHPVGSDRGAQPQPEIRSGR